MKRPPRVHFLSFAPADYLASRVRTRSLVSNDPNLRVGYLEILFQLHASGGSLPYDAAFLADALGLEQSEVERIIPILLELGRCSRGGLVEVDGQLQNVRITEDLATQAAQRQKAALDGAKGARARELALAQQLTEVGRPPDLAIAGRSR